MSESEYGDRKEGKLRAQFGIWCSEDPVAGMEGYKESLRVAREAKLDVNEIPPVNYIVPAGPDVFGRGM